MKKITAALFSLLAATSTMAQEAKDWPQYMGPSHNNHSEQKGLLRSWPENGPEVLWSADAKGIVHLLLYLCTRY